MNSSIMKRGALAASLFAVVQFAFAHAMPKQQNPAPNSTVAAPGEVAIEFGEALEPSFSKLVVVDAAGKQVNTAASTVDANDKKRMSVTLGVLSSGTYRVNWTAVADDGHRTQGHYNFKVK
jgi:methionine-rich copper-binding protein CopC